MTNNSKILRKQSAQKRKRARMKRIQKEIATEIIEIIFPDMPPEVLRLMEDENSVYAKRGIEGKWIDGSEMTPEKEGYLQQLANELLVNNTTPDQQKQLKKRLVDLNNINNELDPEKKRVVISLDI